MPKLAIVGGKQIRDKPFQAHPVLGDEERDEIKSVVDSGVLSGFIASPGDSFMGGPKVRALEEEFRAYFSMPFAVAVNSATSGLHAAIAACGIGPGDEVIVPPYTMSATVTAVIHANAVPVFADIDAEIFCISPAAVRAAVTPRTKAIVVVHLFGHPADMDEILKIANEFNLFVIEDCAQAPGATYKYKKVGTFGHAAVFSLNMHKTITSGEGGVLVTKDRSIATKAQLIRNHGEVCMDGSNVSDIVNVVGWNYRMTELDAAVALAQIRKLDYLTAHRIDLANYLISRLSNIQGLHVPISKYSAKHVYFVLPLLYDADVIGASRDIFVKALVKEGIPFGAGYVKPIYLERMFQEKVAYGKEGCPFRCPLYSGKVEYLKGLCPVAESMYEEQLLLTSLCRYPLVRQDMDDIVRAIHKILENKTELIDAQEALSIVGELK